MQRWVDLRTTGVRRTARWRAAGPAAHPGRGAVGVVGGRFASAAGRVRWAAICGTANCSRSTCVGTTTCRSGCGNVSACSGRWGSGSANGVPRSPRRTRNRWRRLKKLRRLARRRDVELWSQDECHFQRHGTRCRMWVPPEDKDPVVFHAPTRQSVACFGAEPAQRQVRPPLFPGVQRRRLRGLPEGSADAARAQEDGGRSTTRVTTAQNCFSRCLPPIASTSSCCSFPPTVRNLRPSSAFGG